MIAIKKVLVATDFSDRSRLAVSRAMVLCREHGAHLEILHVIEELPPPDHLSMDQYMEKVREQLNGEAAQAISQEIPCHVQCERGKGLNSIIRNARKVAADLIVIGAHGQHLLLDKLLGTTADNLIRQAEIPVLVVKQAAQTDYGRVLVPTDFSDESRKALHAAGSLAPAASVDLLHVYGVEGEGQLSMAQAGEEARKRYRQRTEIWAMMSMDEWRQGVNLDQDSVKQHVRKGYAPSAIIQFAAEQQHDLVAMGTHGSSGLSRFLLGSVTESTLRTVHSDVLIVPAGLRTVSV
jgi:nucleotide-binding universal stress UspA family protein